MWSGSVPCLRPMHWRGWTATLAAMENLDHARGDANLDFRVDERGGTEYRKSGTSM